MTRTLWMLGVALCLVWGVVAQADDTVDPVTASLATEGAVSDLPPPGPPPAAEDVEPLTSEVASGLRCPVCQGLSVAASPSKTAVAMKDRVRELVVAGYTEAQIQDYFVARYGEWVLLAPPASGLAWFLWLGPAVLLGLVGVWAAGVINSWRREPDAVPLPSDVGLSDKDPYEERLLRELEEEP